VDKPHVIATWRQKDGEDFLEYITRHEWRKHMTAVLLAGKATLEGECKYVVRAEGRTILLHWFFNGDPDLAAQKYVNKDKDVPNVIVRAMLEKHKPKKGGRYSNREEWAKQKASDIACFLAVQHLLEKGIKPTPAGEQVGKLMNLSRQAVLGAWQRLESPAKK